MADEHACDEHCIEQRNVSIALIFVTGAFSLPWMRFVAPIVRIRQLMPPLPPPLFSAPSPAGLVAYGGSIVPWHMKRCFRKTPMDAINVSVQPDSARGRGVVMPSPSGGICGLHGGLARDADARLCTFQPL